MFNTMSDRSGHQQPPGERSYRQLVRSHLLAERVVVQQTDLGLYSTRPVAAAAKEAVIAQRAQLEAYIRNHPDFLHRLTPLPIDPLAPPIVRHMLQAAQAAQVGPMAAVAGALAEQVGRELMPLSDEIIVENGGDIFLRIGRPVTMAVFAGSSPLSLKIGLRVTPESGVKAVCTSSGTVGHSLSFGRADAACVLGHDCALADAAATALGNRVRAPGDIQAAIRWAQGIAGLLGVLIVVGEKMGAWGALEVAPL
jgi:hypothetical protein